MGRILDSITTYLRDQFEGEGTGEGQQIEPADGDTIVFQFKGSGDRQWGCLVVADEDLEQVMFYSVLLEQAPKKRRDEVMRFTTMANYGMSVGNFEIDLDDGEVRFKTAIDVENAELSPALCRNLVELNMAMMEHYYDGLTAVVSGQSSAKAAIEAIEQQADDEDEDDAEA